MTILEDFKFELEEDTKIDEINLLDKQMMLPAIKHKWVARLIFYKRELNSLLRRKKEMREAVVQNLEKEGIPPGLPKSSLDKKIESSSPMIKIQEQIEDTEIIIQYLEKVENIFKTMTYDFKNIVDISRMETT